MYVLQKKAHKIFVRFRGLERIRTAVDGFADHCLATRPRDHNRTANLILFCRVTQSFYKSL